MGLPSDENLHVATSVLETGEWMHLVPRDKPVFFTAQGLFMYLNEKDLRGLLQEIANEFPSSTILFDSISKRLSDKAMSPNGWKLTNTYKTPPMPFGANKDKAQGVFQSWVPNAKVEEVPWPLKKASGFFHAICCSLSHTFAHDSKFSAWYGNEDGISTFYKIRVAVPFFLIYCSVY